jgi:glycosyltransferase involved in cell wall biosynthesis
MKKLDIHTIWNTPVVGYGRVYNTLRDEIKRLLADNDSLELVDAYTGGDVQLFVGAPLDENVKHFQRKADRTICLSMWESTKIPNSVIANINAFDELIVPSEWGRGIFIDNGVTIPMHVVPLGINSDDWPIQDRDRRPDDLFTIIWQGSYFGDRKGGQDIVDAYRALNLTDARLILKLNPKCTSTKMEWDLPYTLSHNIRSLGRVYDQAQMLELLASADLSVYPSYGEGFGLIPLEHMATGLPVILSDNTAMRQYSDFRYNIPIPCTPKAAIYGELVGVDYLPRQDKLREAIMFAYENRDRIKAIGENAASWVRDNWSMKKAAERIIDLCQNDG